MFRCNLCSLFPGTLSKGQKTPLAWVLLWTQWPTSESITYVDAFMTPPPSPPVYWPQHLTKRMQLCNNCCIIYKYLSTRRKISFLRSWSNDCNKSGKRDLCQVLFKSAGDIFFYAVTFYFSFCKRVLVCDILLLPWVWSVEIKVMNK